MYCCHVAVSILEDDISVAKLHQPLLVASREIKRSEVTKTGCKSLSQCNKSNNTVNVQSMDDTRNITQNRQQNVDAKVSIEATLEEDTDWREEDGKDDLCDDVAMKLKKQMR